MQRRTTGRHDFQPRTRREQAAHIVCRLEDLFEIVEDQQQSPVTQELFDYIQDDPAVNVVHA